MDGLEEVRGLLLRLLSIWNVIASIMARDIKVRFGGGLFGYALVLATPVAWIALTILSFELIGRVVPVFTDPVSFVLAGILPYLLFRLTITATTRANSVYESLFVVPGVGKVHVLLALSLIELMNAVVVYFLVSLFNCLVFSHWEISSAPLLAYGILIAWVSGFAIGCFVDSLARVFPALPRMLPVILRPTYIISAVFFTANEMPEGVVKFLGWNPLLHVNEVVREGMFDGYRSFYVDYVYPFALSAVFLMLTLLINRYLDERKQGSDLSGED